MCQIWPAGQGLRTAVLSHNLIPYPPARHRQPGQVGAADDRRRTRDGAV